MTISAPSAIPDSATFFTAPEALTRNSVMLAIRISKPGNSRRVPSSSVSVDADETMIQVAKDLVDSPEYRAIRTLDGEIRRWLYIRSLPSYGVLKGGVYRVPLSLVDEVEGKLQAFQQQRTILAGKFLAVYPNQVSDARERLRSLFSEGDYPSVQALAGAFSLSWRYLYLGTPNTLPGDLLQAERKKAMAEVVSEVEEIRQGLRLAFSQLIDHAVDRLGVNPSGKKVVFRDSMVKNLQEFLAYFNQRNLTGDQELAQLVERARAVISGVDPDVLRNADVVRASVASAFTAIKKEMDENLITRPSRKIVLEDEEEG